MLSRDQIRDVSTIYLKSELEKAHLRKFDSPNQRQVWRMYIRALEQELAKREKV